MPENMALTNALAVKLNYFCGVVTAGQTFAAHVALVNQKLLKKLE